MKNLKVSIKLIISFLIVIILAIGVAFTGLWGMHRIKKVADNMYDYNVVSIDSLGLIRENFALQRNTTRELIIYNSGTEQYLLVETYLRELESEMNRYVDKYASSINTEEEYEQLEKFQDVYYDDYKSFKEELIQIADKDRTDDAMNLIRSKGSTIVNNISDILSDIYEINIKQSEKSLIKNEDIYTTVIKLEVIALAVTILIVIILVTVITRLIAVPLSNMVTALNQMGTNGDLTFNAEMKKYSDEYALRKDEIGLATQAVLSFLNHIWYIERVLSRIAKGNFSIEVKKLSDRDTIGLSVSKVVDSLNEMFNRITAAEEAAQSANKAKSAFLAHISHEIRTPLNAIIGMSTIIKNSNGDSKKTISSINQIIISSHHLLNILNDVLDMSKIESGKLELVHAPFRLRESLEEIFGIIRQRCSEKNINFLSNIDKLKDLTVIGDKMRLNQVLINLLGNSAKFTDKDGQISLNIDVLEENENNARIKFTVIDNGIGMSEQKLSKLFNPFEQGDNTTATKYGGTGLGLSISWNIVTMMGGTITVKSEENIGSSFSFELAFEKGIISDDKSEDAEPIEINGKRILLVEDNEINRVIVCELLESTGVIIQQAEDGLQAVNMFLNSDEGYYDLIFMDVQMPLLDGYGATMNIRSAKRADAKSIPIIAMTANAYKEDVDRALASGMNGHISKPVDMNLMIKILKKYIPHG